MGASNTLLSKHELGNDSHYLLSVARAFANEKSQQGLSVEEIVQLAFKNPAFKTIFSTQLQGEIFISELTQISIFIHSAITNSILLELANIEMAELMHKSVSEIENNEKIQVMYSEYCSQIKASDEKNREIIENRLREAIISMEEKIKGYQQTINALANHINILNLKKSALENENALLIREKYSTLFSAFQSGLPDFYLIKIDENPADIEYTRVTKAELIQELKKYCIANPSAKMNEADYADLFRNIVDDKISRGLTEKLDTEVTIEKTFSLATAANSVFEAVISRIDVLEMNDSCDRIEVNEREISKINVEIEIDKISIESTKEVMSDCTRKRDVITSAIDSGANVDDILKSLMSNSAPENSGMKIESAKNSNEVDIEHTSFKP